MSRATWLKRLLSRLPGAAPPAPGLTLERPGAVIYAVGDPHGRLDLYDRLETMILADPARPPKAPMLLVLLGDLVDRGPDSAGLLARMLAPAPSGVERLCLMGNHEAMALEFFARPHPAHRWLDFGGGETLASYGIAPEPRLGHRRPGRNLAAEIAHQIPEAHLAFLRGLPLWLRVGPHFFSHAGPDPARPLGAQLPRQLLWSRDFNAGPTPPPPDLGQGLAVQGHVPLPQAEQRGWRLGIDTGAFKTGRLTAVRLCEGQPPAFLEAALT